MKRSESILRRQMPGEEFSERELNLAEMVYREVTGGGSRLIMPSRSVSVGEVLAFEGKRYLCVERSEMRTPSDACRGCDFARKYRNCDRVMCSSWDRHDGRNVWYLEVGPEDEPL